MIVILTEAFGNHANRLWQDANLRAYCRQRSWWYFNPTIQNIWQDSSLIGKLRSFVGMVTYRVLRKLAHRGWITIEELTVDFLPVENDHRGVRFVQGWAFRDEDMVRQHRDFVLESVKAGGAPRRWAREARHRLGANSDHLVGVHIRRGDYRDWEGGMYFFSDEVYLGKLSEMTTLLGGRTSFVLFSNEPVDQGFFQASMSAVFVSDGTWQEDLHLMASCDYLIGPPSTFTMWASFMGNVPTYHIRNANQPLALSAFRVFPQVGQ